MRDANIATRWRKWCSDAPNAEPNAVSGNSAGNFRNDRRLILCMVENFAISIPRKTAQ